VLFSLHPNLTLTASTVYKMCSDGSEGVPIMVRTPSLSSLLLLKTKQKSANPKKLLQYFLVLNLEVYKIYKMHGDVGEGVRTYHVMTTFSNITTPLKKLKQNSHKLVKVFNIFCLIFFPL